MTLGTIFLEGLSSLSSSNPHSRVGGDSSHLINGLETLITSQKSQSGLLTRNQDATRPDSPM